MGFGHRVYKNYDPRAKLVKESADEVLAELGVTDPLLDLAKELEEIALHDEYFIERKLYPNVDFYTGVIYKAMGFPTRMFTGPVRDRASAGLARAQWREAGSDPQTKIGRPQQLYIGATERNYRGSEPPTAPDQEASDALEFAAKSGTRVPGSRGRTLVAARVRSRGFSIGA